MNLVGVLNLVISGIPSILLKLSISRFQLQSFKPCYKWNTFNTITKCINGIFKRGFKPCYKWNTFNTNNNNINKHTTTKSFKPCYKWNTFNTLTPPFKKNELLGF